MAIFNKEFLEFLNEDALYKADKGQDDYTITVDIGKGREQGFLLDPYIKVYDSANIKNKNTHVVRIYLLKSETATHTDFHKELILNTKSKKKILDIMNEKSTSKKYREYIVYDAIWKFIYDTGKEYGLKTANKISLDQFKNNLEDI